MATKPGPKMQEPYPTDVLEFVHKKDKPFVTTSDVSEEFESVTKRTIYDRLDQLESDGELDSEQIGANSKVWWPSGQDRA